MPNNLSEFVWIETILYAMSSTQWENYVKKALEELAHIFTAKHHYTTSIIEQPDNRAKMQYVEEDNITHCHY